MTVRTFGIITSACVLVACHGEPKTLEPRSPPPRAAPAVPMPPRPIPPGYGRVMLNGTDGPLDVTARADTTFVPPGYPVPPNRTGELCTTPCVVDLPVGRYKLYMTSADGSYSHGDSDVLDVSEGLTHYERAPGKYVQPEWIPVLPTVVVSVGVLAALGGVALLSAKDDSQRTSGAFVLGGGAAVAIVGGFWLYDESRGAIQAGATTKWTEPVNQRGNP